MAVRNFATESLFPLTGIPVNQKAMEMFQSVNHKYQGRGSLMAEFPMSNNAWPQIFQLVRCHILLCAWQLCSCFNHFIFEVSSCSPAHVSQPVCYTPGSALGTWLSLVQASTPDLVLTKNGLFCQISPPQQKPESTFQPAFLPVLGISLLPNSIVSWMYSMHTKARLTFGSASLS